MIFICTHWVFSPWYLGYFNSIILIFIYPEGRPGNICRFRNSGLTNINIGHFDVIFKDTGDFVVVLTTVIKSKEVFCTQHICKRSRKMHLNGVLGLPRNPSPCIMLSVSDFLAVSPSSKCHQWSVPPDRNCQRRVELELSSDSSEIHTTASGSSHLHCPQIVDKARSVALLHLYIDWNEWKLWTTKLRRGNWFRKQAQTKYVFWNEWEVLQKTGHLIALMWTPNNNFR